MSSLRMDSLRLVWLETFLAVAETENISEAARTMAINQSTASRYLQKLEQWTGKKLIEVGGINAPGQPALSIAISEEGRNFRELAHQFVTLLDDFRTEEAKQEPIIREISSMIEKMEDDFEINHGRLSGSFSTIKIISQSISKKSNFEHVKSVHTIVKSFFCRYEEATKK